MPVRGAGAVQPVRPYPSPGRDPPNITRERATWAQGPDATTSSYENGGDVSEDLTRLGPDAFEQLVLALAVHVLGPGITAFGDGPDGGREASFSGRQQYPNTADPWDGYGVCRPSTRTSCSAAGQTPPGFSDRPRMN